MTATKPVTPENLFAALLAWDTWEHAAMRALDVSRAAESREAIEYAWQEAERARAEAKSYEPPRATLGNTTAEQRVLRAAIVCAREVAEETVRVNSKDLT